MTGRHQIVDQIVEPSSALNSGIAKLTRRQIMTRSLLLAAAAALSPSRVLAQGVPFHCVPPIPTSLPIPFVSATSQPVRVRKSVFELSAEEVGRLKAAYAALRRLHEETPTDPRSWHHQALIYCWYCSGALDGLSAPEIHFGWFFLPWHRAYLNFHEQILADLIGDPTFALPYWDWDTPDRNRFPDAYMDPADPTNPLFDPFRAVGPDSRIQPNLTGPETMAQVMGQATFALFAGAGEGASGQIGSIEGAPHGGVHLWVTNPNTLRPPRVNMGVLGTAAFDPVFYAHHANIDRLWQVWLGSDPTHANPSEGAWQQQGFYFYDQRRQWTRIEVRQLVDSESSLRYRYQQPSAPTRTPVAGGATVPTPARSAPALRPMTQILELSVHSDGAALTPDPLTLQVDPPPPAAASLRAALEAPNRVILRIDGVEIPPDQAALVNVFLNRPAATASTETTVPGFVGTIVVVPNTVSTGAHVHRSLLHNFAFDVTEQIRRTAEPSGPLSVTLVPFQGDGTRPAEISLRYRRVYLVTQ